MAEEIEFYDRKKRKEVLEDIDKKLKEIKQFSRDKDKCITEIALIIRELYKCRVRVNRVAIRKNKKYRKMETAASYRKIPWDDVIIAAGIPLDYVKSGVPIKKEDLL